MKYRVTSAWLEDEMELPEGTLIVTSTWKRNEENWRLILLIPIADSHST